MYPMVHDGAPEDKQFGLRSFAKNVMEAQFYI